MSKQKSAFFCQECGYEAPKWLGKCPSCSSWNTFVEEIVASGKQSISFSADTRNAKPTLINEIENLVENRMQLVDVELNRVLGGGLVKGALVLIGGEPGIGKSTLMLQMAIQEPLNILYVSGEESEQQVRMRAERIGIKNNHCQLLTETNLVNILNHSKALMPEMLIIDSIQTLFYSAIDSSPGSVSQVRECTAQLLRFAKETNVPVFLIGHITKDGSIAGPKVLEHMVDAVLQFEGDRNHIYRILRAQKNRFGATSEIGIYEMISQGLRQVTNPSEVLISEKEEALSGHAIAATVEGIRPLMIEVQALVSTAVYGTPQRSTTGYNAKRLNMLLAVLEKRAGFHLGAKDVFLNITGGISIEDPAIDLAVIGAILSSNQDHPIDRSFCFAAEVGLAGEIRPVQRVDQRITEAAKLGFEHIIVSKHNKMSAKPTGIKVIGLGRVEEMVELLFS